jgi:hypothetical protein
MAVRPPHPGLQDYLPGYGPPAAGSRRVLTMPPRGGIQRAVRPSAAPPGMAPAPMAPAAPMAGLPPAPQGYRAPVASAPMRLNTAQQTLVDNFSRTFGDLGSLGNLRPLGPTETATVNGRQVRGDQYKALQNAASLHNKSKRKPRPDPYGLPASPEEAYAQANRANEQRYSQGLGIYDTMLANSQRMGGFQREQIGRRQTVGNSHDLMGLIDRGFGNSPTMLASLNRGRAADAGLEQLALEDALLRQQNAVLGDKAGFIERRTDAAPDLGLIASLVQNAAASGGGRVNRSGGIRQGGQVGPRLTMRRNTVKRSGGGSAKPNRKAFPFQDVPRGQR